MTVTPPKKDIERIEKLRAFYLQRKRLPSYREMLALFGVKSKNSVYKFIQKLLTQQILEQDEESNTLSPGPALLALPRLGSVAAGWPSPAEEELADAITLDDYLITNRSASFLLTISGDSMVDAGLHPGDLVIVDKSRIPKSGDIVIAQVDNNFTVKRFKRSGNTVELLPENAAMNYPPITADEEMRIEGVVSGVVRKY